MSHGTAGYARGCRCERCRDAKREYDQQRHDPARRYDRVDRGLLREALLEIAPFGLTDDCPVRKKR